LTRALVTGAGSERGIGFACARALAAAGMEVAVTATTERIGARAAELGGIAHVADLTDPEQVEALAAAVGPVDVLVCNAGMAQTGREPVDLPFLALDPAAWETELARTLSTAFLCARAFTPAMAERGYGRIVFVSSITGPRTAIPGSAAYGAAKAGMEGLMRGMALELAPRGVTVNAIAPGLIETDMSRPFAGTEKARIRELIPMRRVGQPAEVASLAVYLASEQASYLTGQVIAVDGGIG
jgi:3-oxoacyl-[acyl-carrier protein] reductase